MGLGNLRQIFDFGKLQPGHSASEAKLGKVRQKKIF